MKKMLVAMTAVGLVAGVAALLWPSAASALGGSEIETNFYQCPENATSLAQCTWTGWVFRDCHNNNIVEGTQGNYQVRYSESCQTGSSSAVCKELIVLCEVDQHGNTTCTPLWFQAGCLL